MLNKIMLKDIPSLSEYLEGVIFCLLPFKCPEFLPLNAATITTNIY